MNRVSQAGAAEGGLGGPVGAYERGPDGKWRKPNRNTTSSSSGLQNTTTATSGRLLPPSLKPWEIEAQRMAEAEAAERAERRRTASSLKQLLAERRRNSHAQKQKNEKDVSAAVKQTLSSSSTWPASASADASSSSSSFTPTATASCPIVNAVTHQSRRMEDGALQNVVEKIVIKTTFGGDGGSGSGAMRTEVVLHPSLTSATGSCNLRTVSSISDRLDELALDSQLLSRGRASSAGRMISRLTRHSLSPQGLSSVGAGVWQRTLRAVRVIAALAKSSPSIGAQLYHMATIQQLASKLHELEEEARLALAPNSGTSTYQATGSLSLTHVRVGFRNSLAMSAQHVDVAEGRADRASAYDGDHETRQAVMRVASARYPIPFWVAPEVTLQYACSSACPSGDGGSKSTANAAAAAAAAAAAVDAEPTDYPLKAPDDAGSSKSLPGALAVAVPSMIDGGCAGFRVEFHSNSPASGSVAAAANANGSVPDLLTWTAKIPEKTLELYRKVFTRRLSEVRSAIASSGFLSSDGGGGGGGGGDGGASDNTDTLMVQPTGIASAAVAASPVSLPRHDNTGNMAMNGGSSGGGGDGDGGAIPTTLLSLPNEVLEKIATAIPDNGVLLALIVSCRRMNGVLGPIYRARKLAGKGIGCSAGAEVLCYSAADNTIAFYPWLSSDTAAVTPLSSRQFVRRLLGP